jgi:DNA topoisomerase VI subunit A
VKGSLFDKNVIKMMEDEGLLHSGQSFFVFGNAVDPKATLIFEKTNSFKNAVEHFDNIEEYLFICSAGIPSDACLEMVRKLNCPRIIYFGDLDPISILNCITFVYLRRAPSHSDRPKKSIIFGGLTFTDYKKYLGKTSDAIKMNNTEKAVLKQLERFNLPYLKEELEFLAMSGRKVEMDALSTRFGFTKYLQDKLIRCKTRKEAEQSKGNAICPLL